MGSAKRRQIVGMVRPSASHRHDMMKVNKTLPIAPNSALIHVCAPAFIARPNRMLLRIRVLVATSRRRDALPRRLQELVGEVLNGFFNVRRTNNVLNSFKLRQQIRI